MATTTAAAANTTALSMKLLVDTKAQRVLYAEANNDAVDFLFSLLALPISTAVRLIGPGSMVGSAGNLFASVVNIDGAYVRCEYDLRQLLNPTVSSQKAASNLSFLSWPNSGSSRMATGFVKDAVTYTVTDSLKVTPMSSISSITLLNTLGVRDFGGLQEKTVWLGYSEVSIPTKSSS
jgi:hypothetical protein